MCLFLRRTREEKVAKVGRVFGVVAVAALVAAVLGVGRAEAGLFGCRYPQATQPFAAWGDYARYVPVPGGSFEDARSDWRLSGGATIVDGNEPFNLTGSDHARSLVIPPGGSAMTPGVCLTILTPTIRFVGHSTDGSPVRVAIYTKTVLGLLKVASFGAMSVGTSWDPSSIQNFTIENVLGLLNLSRSNIYFEFTPTGGATVQLDDVLLDPFIWR
jgi:hypothetical protein